MPELDSGGHLPVPPLSYPSPESSHCSTCPAWWRLWSSSEPPGAPMLSLHTWHHPGLPALAFTLGRLPVHDGGHQVPPGPGYCHTPLPSAQPLPPLPGCTFPQTHKALMLSTWVPATLPVPGYLLPRQKSPPAPLALSHACKEGSTFPPAWAGAQPNSVLDL